MSIRYVPGTGLITEAQRGIILLLPHFKYEKSGSIGICKKDKNEKLLQLIVVSGGNAAFGKHPSELEVVNQQTQPYPSGTS